MNFFKWTRIAVASIVFVAISALFLDFAKIVPLSWHVLAHLQIVPAVLGLAVGILSFWAVATVLFGRMYCSAVCPLGILQDVFSRISKTVRGKKGKYRFRPEMKKTRIAVLVFFLFSFAIFPLGVTLLDPYGNFGRIVTTLIRPSYLEGNNFLAERGIEIGEIRFAYEKIPYEFHATFVALAALILVGVLSVLFGRRYCNTICPVGTFLGLLSKLSLFRVRLKSDCISCGLCERTCKGECIDSKNKFVDVSRCVACFNCLGTCKRESIVYSIPLKTEEEREDAEISEHRAATVPVEIPLAPENDRRTFLQWSIFSLFVPTVAGSLGAARSSSPPPDPSLPTGVSRIGYELTAPIMPPGAGDFKNFHRLCTGCQLCVSKCPAKILRPSTTEWGWTGFMQPVVQFNHHYCNYDCTICTEVCPSHALVPLSVEEKHRLQIGKVVFLKDNCVVHTQGKNCGACAEHCPTGAVQMVEYGDPEKGLTIPVVRPELCVGCGACEYICPVRPYRAIYVDGTLRHGVAELDYDPDAKQESVELDDFGF